MDKKRLLVIGVALIVLIPIVAITISRGGDRPPAEEEPSEEWAALLVDSVQVERVPQDGKLFIGTVVEGSEDDDVINLATTPLLFDGDSYSPLVLTRGGGSETLDRFVGLSQMDTVELPSEDAVNGTCTLATYGWARSDAAITVSTIDDALQCAPLAKLLGIPVLYANGSVREDTRVVAGSLGVDYCIAVGGAARLSTRTMRLPSDAINDFYLTCLEKAGIQCDYMVVTNPRDVTDYSWGKEDRIPIPHLSLISAQLAAHHNAPIFFAEGVKEIGEERGSPEFVQIGARAEDVNAIAEYNRDHVVKAGKELIESKTGVVENMYLALVGGPVALPFHYHYEASSEGETTFSDTDYIASDYYFGDLDEDYTMELAVGRIIARDVEDASVTVARSLLEASMDFQYEDDGDLSEDIYDSLSSSWRENSITYIGTTRTGPLPGCLKHAKAYQFDTQSAGGFAATALENFKANTQTVGETVDKVQYAVYYGHGNPYCWWSNREDYITADTAASARLKPGTAIAMACMTARVDNSTDSLSELISLGFIHGGFNCYIGATRLAYGLVELYDDPDTSILGGPVEDTDALYLVDRFTHYICEEDLDVGMALMRARNDLTARFSIDGSMGARVAMYEYVLYGDPAYNMYVPALDG